MQSRYSIVTLLFSCSFVFAQETAKKEFTPEAIAFYEKDVLPILKANCYKCHAEGKIKGNFSLLSRQSIAKGGDLGPAFDHQKPEASNLLKAVKWQDGLEMPPNGKLPAKQVDILTQWVKAGLPMKDQEGAVEAKHTSKGGVVTPESKNYWAYKPVVKPAAPKVKDNAWVSSPIDAFILKKLEEKGIKANGPAEKIAIVRRAYYDLTGLPPTPAQVDEFVNDRSPNAYEKLLDQLLQSPLYGEKWGRHWLDVVRYAETNGYERDGPKPYAWRFRDYVIKSFNEDKPYDQFVKEQLAGDEMSGDNPDPIIATGFYRLGLWDDEPVDPKQALFDEYDDIVATTSQAFLGMTMNCARCHEHKIDPIPHADYYKLLAFFRDVKRFSNDRNVRSAANVTDITPRGIRATYENELKQRRDRIEELTRQMVTMEDVAIKKMPAEDQRASEGPDRPQVVQKVTKFMDDKSKVDYLKLKKEREGLERKPLPEQDLALSVNNCMVKPPQTNVLIRGNASSPGAVVEPAFPEVLGFPAPKIPEPAKNARSSGRRTILANWIASKSNPLTARVMVNRIWQGHFGRGIVSSSNDFGKFGSGVTHPELIDWLAAEFMEGDWKIKRFHKLIMMSNTYRQSAVVSEETLQRDPGNLLYGRFPMRRLVAEEVRDSILAVSGQLNLKAGGPSIYPKIPQEVLAGQSRPGEGWPITNGPEANRRTVYVHIKRSLQLPILAQYDQADADNSCPVRYTTTVPTQSLGMLNGDFANESATAFANRLKKEANDLESQVKLAVKLTTARVPSAEEVSKDVAFIREFKAKSNVSDDVALRRYCLLLLNTNEFVYLD